MRLWEERDPQTQQIVAIHQDISNFQQRRTFWMDGRPHPSQYAEHTWMGFSTANWEGDTLVVTTTHIKQMWHRRNGIPQSDRVALTERYIRHGSVLTLITVTDDPPYLTEPLVKSTNMLMNPRRSRRSSCYAVSERRRIASQPRGAVPHYLPGENPFLREFRQQSHLPAIATRGGERVSRFQVTLKAASQEASPR